MGIIAELVRHDGNSMWAHSGGNIPSPHTANNILSLYYSVLISLFNLRGTVDKLVLPEVIGRVLNELNERYE